MQNLDKNVTNCFANVILQEVIKTKFVNNYRAYARMKNKVIKTQHDSFYSLTKEWFSEVYEKINNAH